VVKAFSKNILWIVNYYMLNSLPYELLHEIISYSTTEDVCHLMATSTNLYTLISGIELSEVNIRGFAMYDFIKWLERHGISKVRQMKIFDYNMSNDHCMYSYIANCDCVEEIKRGLEKLHIETLILHDCKIDDSDMMQLKWSSKIRNLHLTNYNSESDMKWLSTNLPELRDLNIYYYYSEYQAFFLPTSAFLETGIQNGKLERLSTNMFFFGEDLEVMLRNSCKNENLNVFSLSEMSPSSIGKEIMDLIEELYPNGQMFLHI
jgi:hypothetical protein